MKRKKFNNSVGIAFVIAMLFLRPSDSFGQFQMANTLVPLTGNDYPIVFANDAKGGHHQVATIAARNLITTLRRQVGMLCTVLDNGDGTGLPKTYQLICADTKAARDNNASWVLFIPGGGTLGWNALTGNPFTITAPVANQLLRFDGTNWINVDKAIIPLNGFGTATGNILMGDGTNNYTITNLASPVAATDAVTKGFMDSVLASSIAANGVLYQGTAVDTAAFSALTWSNVSAGTNLGHLIISPICTLDMANYTWIAFPTAWGNQSFFYQYGGNSYAVIDGLQKRVIKAAITGSVDYQIWFFNTKPNTAVSLIANNN